MMAWPLGCVVLRFGKANAAGAGSREEVSAPGNFRLAVGCNFTEANQMLERRLCTMPRLSLDRSLKRDSASVTLDPGT